MTILQANSHSIGQKSGEIWTGQALLQPISFKSDRLLGFGQKAIHHTLQIEFSKALHRGIQKRATGLLFEHH